MPGESNADCTADCTAYAADWMHARTADTYSACNAYANRNACSSAYANRNAYTSAYANRNAYTSRSFCHTLAASG